MITESIPLNSSGKVDAKKLASGSVTGSRYSVKPVRADGKVIDILLVPATEGENATMGAGIPEELEGDPYNILSEVFAIMPDLSKGRFSKLFRVPGLRDLFLKLTGFDIHNIPASMRNMSPKMLQLAYRKYVMPLTKGVTKMNDKRNAPAMPMFPGMMPMMPPMMPPVLPMPFMPGMDSWGWFSSKKNRDTANEQMDALKSNLKTFWEQMVDMERSSAEASKEQWNQFFGHMMDMQETFAESLPDEAPSMPGLPSISPKAFAKRMNAFQEAANEHFVERADSTTEFLIKRQEQTYDMVQAAMSSKDASSADSDTSSEQ